MGREGCDKQLEWWDERQRPFDFERLPLEIQDLLLLQCIGAFPPVDFWSTMETNSLQITLALEALYRNPLSSAVFEIPEIAYPILTLSKRIEHVARKILEPKTIKKFDTSASLKSVINICPVTMVNSARVQLAFSISELAQFFGMKLLRVSLSNDYVGMTTGIQLKQWTNLTYLEIYFESTFVQRDTTPWFAMWRYRNGDVPVKEVYPCRRILVDWLMLSAFEHVQHIPSVNITDYVKTMTCEKWFVLLGKGADWEKATRHVRKELKSVRALHYTTL